MTRAPLRRGMKKHKFNRKNIKWKITDRQFGYFYRYNDELFGDSTELPNRYHFSLDCEKEKILDGIKEKFIQQIKRTIDWRNGKPEVYDTIFVDDFYIIISRQLVSGREVYFYQINKQEEGRIFQVTKRTPFIKDYEKDATKKSK